MASSSAVLTDNSKLSRLDTLLFKLESWLNLAGGITIFLLVMLTVSNVLGRWLLDSPISGYIDWIEQSMAFFAFLGLAYCQRMGAHIRMDMIVGSLRGRLHWFSELLSVLLMFAVTVLLIYGSYLHAWRAFDIGDSSMDIGLPTWPAKMVVPIALTFLALRLLIQIWGYVRAIKNKSPHPIAIPVADDMISQSVHDAEYMLKQNNKNN